MTLYLTNSAAGNFQELSETSPGADADSSPNVGWQGWKSGAPEYSEFERATVRAAGTFDVTVLPDGSINPTVEAGKGDCYRTTSTYTTTFIAGIWSFFNSFRAIGLANFDFQINMRVFRDTSADGSTATEVTSATIIGSVITDLNTLQLDSTASWNAPSFSLSNEYLFIQAACFISEVGGSNPAFYRIGDTATRIITTNQLIDPRRMPRGAYTGVRY